MKKIICLALLVLTVYAAQAQTTQYGVQYPLDRISQRSSALDGMYVYEYDGSGIPIYVVDGPLHTNHTEFGGRATQLTGAGFPLDYHSTAVAGFAGSSTYGVAKNANIKGLYFPDTELAKAAADWLDANVVPPAVVVLPYSWSMFDPERPAAVQRSISHGFTWVLSAGNAPLDVCTDSNIPHEAIIVGAIQTEWNNPTDMLSPISSYGNCLTVFAPIGGSAPTVYYENGILSNTMTAGVTGTSFSGPMVAGAAAQILQQYPNFTPAQVKQTLINRSTKGMISGVLPSNSPNRILYTQETEISGKVYTPYGISMSNVKVELVNSSGAVVAVTYTSSFGLYRFDEVLPYNDYYVRATSKRYRYTVQSLPNVIESWDNIDFVGID